MKCPQCGCSDWNSFLEMSDGRWSFLYLFRLISEETLIWLTTYRESGFVRMDVCRCCDCAIT